MTFSKLNLNIILKQVEKLLLTGKSGLDIEGKNFQLDIGAKYIGKSEWQIDYTKVAAPIGANIIQAPFLNYSAANVVKVTNAEILANIEIPLF